LSAVTEEPVCEFLKITTSDYAKVIDVGIADGENGSNNGLAYLLLSLAPGHKLYFNILRKCTLLVKMCLKMHTLAKLLR
jgi:hypothetical protein